MTIIKGQFVTDDGVQVFKVDRSDEFHPNSAAIKELMELRRTEFRAELQGLINRYSQENGSDTPDFILADYLMDCLDAWNAGVNRRAKWYAPAQQRIDPPPKSV